VLKTFPLLFSLASLWHVFFKESASEGFPQVARDFPKSLKKSAQKLLKKTKKFCCSRPLFAQARPIQALKAGPNSQNW